MNKKKLKDIASITMGQSPEAKYVSVEKKGIPLLNGPAEFTERYPIPVQYTLKLKRSAEPKDILFCVRGSTTGRMNIADQKYAIGRGLASIRHNISPTLNTYVKALIEVNLKKLLGGTSGSVFPNLTKDNLYNLECFVHSEYEQKKIAKTLSDIDAKIELNNKINQELEAMAKTLYDYWFVQFDFPDAIGKPYKSSGRKMVYNDDLKIEIPESWSSSTISGWIANDKSGDWGKEQVEGNYTEKVSCIRGADINGLNGKGEVKAPERYILEKNSHKILEVGDFIIEISGGSPTQSTGRMAFIIEETLERFENPLICSNFCKAVTLKEKHMLFNFVYEWNRIYDAGVLFGWEGKTSGIKNFLFESFVTNYKIAQPPKELMELFYKKAKPIHAQIQKNLQQNQKLADLRDWLLPMLMNGQVTVGEVYDESDVVLGMVAEPLASYSKDETLTDLFPESNLYVEVACLVAIEKEMNRISRGKTWIQKTANHLKEIKKEPKLKNVPFEEFPWGMFSKTIAQAIDNNPFLTKANVGATTVYKLRSNKIADITQWMQAPQNRSFVESTRAIVSMYSHRLIENDLDRIELLNTVYRCMQKLGTSDFDLIYNEMRQWPMKEDGFANKAEKFKPEETRHMIWFVKNLK